MADNDGRRMNRPLTSVPLLLFRVWLIAPVVFLWYLLVGPLIQHPKFGVDIAVMVGAMVLLTLLVLFHGEFRQFQRVTPKRILIFFAISFALVVVLIAIFSIRAEQSPGIDALRIPLIASLTLTPALTILSNFAQPTEEESPADDNVAA